MSRGNGGMPSIYNCTDTTTDTMETISTHRDAAKRFNWPVKLAKTIYKWQGQVQKPRRYTSYLPLASNTRSCIGEPGEPHDSATGLRRRQHSPEQNKTAKLIYWQRHCAKARQMASSGEPCGHVDGCVNHTYQCAEWWQRPENGLRLEINTQASQMMKTHQRWSNWLIHTARTCQSK